MVRDYIAEVVNGLKMAGRAGKDMLVLPYSKLVENILNVLKKEGFVLDIAKKGKKVTKFIEVTVNKAQPVTPHYTKNSYFCQ